MSRVVALIDMDCFYVQVEQRDNMAIRGRPCAVVQGTGLLIAISYEARALGVVRGHRMNDARLICPDIHFFNVPEPRGKADLTKYRDAGAEVITVLSEFERCVVERASIDEAYVDMTEEVNFRLVAMETAAITADRLPNTFVVGWESEDAGKTGITSGRVDEWLCSMDESDRRLAVGAIVTEEMRAAILRECTFCCSAGIAHNKILAKLICSRHKPNKQTVLPLSAVNDLLTKTPVQKMRLLGGKLGIEVTQQLGVEFVAELCQFPEKQLQLEFGEKQGSWLYQVCRGVDNDPVKVRKLAQSIGCGKNFPGKAILDSDEKIQRWLRTMSLELEERLIKDKQENKREARLLTVHARTKAGSHTVEASKSCPLLRCDADRLCSEAMRLLHKFQRLAGSNSSHSTWSPAFLSLSISASKFEDVRTNTTSIKQFAFKTQPSPSLGSSGSKERSSDITHGSSVSTSESCVPMPVSYVIISGSSVHKPGSSVPKPGSYVPMPGSSVPKPGSSVPMPGSSVHKPGSFVPIYGSSVPKPGSSIPKPGSSVPNPGSSVPKPGSSVPKPGSSVPKPGSSVSMPGSSVPKNGSYVPKPRSSVPEPGSSVPEPGSSVPMPGSSVPKDGSYVPKPGSYAPKPGSSVPKPGSSVPMPGSSVPMPGSSVPMSGSSVPKPGSSVPKPGSYVPMPGSSVPKPGSYVPMPGSSVPMAGSSVPMAGSSVPMPGSSVPKPGSSVPMPGSSVPMPGSSVPMPGSSVPMPGSSVPMPGSSSSVMISSDPTHGSSATSGSSADRSCQHMQESSDSLLGSSASFARSSVGRSSDPVSRKSSALCGSSSAGDGSFFLDYVRKSRNTSLLSTDVQSLLDTHRNITSGRDDTCVTMPSCHDDTARRSWLCHDDGCHLERDSCLVQCKDAVTKNDNSYFRQSPDLTCEGKNNIGCWYESGNVSRKEEWDDKIVKCIKAAGQIADAVVGLSQLHPSEGTSKNHDDTSVNTCVDTSVNTIQCHQCGDTIEAWKIEEHSDFHLAVELQKRETFTSNSHKRKSTSTSEIKKRRNSVGKTTTLHKFFEAI